MTGKKTMGKGRPIDVVILTIREDEFQAVLSAFPDDQGILEMRRHYSIRTASAGKGEAYTVAVLRQLEQGNGEAQEAARDALEDLKPSLLLVVGIAGGIPSDDVTLGDVVLSSRIHDFSVESRKFDENATYSVTGGPIDRKITNGIAALGARKAELGDWTSVVPTRPEISFNGKGRLYGPPEWQKELKLKLQAAIKRDSQPRFFAGPIASSDRLVKDPSLIFPWVQTARHLLAVEMESGGAYRAARDRCSMLSIRGISDLIGLKRDEAWTKYACSTAAAFSRAYLQTQPVKPKRKSSRSTHAKTIKQESPDQLFLNLIPLEAYPPRIFAAPTSIQEPKRIWEILRAGSTADVPGWILHRKCLYSFTDPSSCVLRKVIDPGTVKNLPTRAFAESEDPAELYVFGRLLQLALQQDMRAHQVRYFRKEKIFAFSGFLNEPPRVYGYSGLKLKSKITVVAHYPAQRSDGSHYTYLRHLGFEERFRKYEGTWFLQINPTYLFTSDGKLALWSHAKKLSGIKRLEKNRAVLSQLLLFADLLQRPSPTGSRLLAFGKPPRFIIMPNVESGTQATVEADYENLKDQLITELGQ